jgi:hypothetical protein
LDFRVQARIGYYYAYGPGLAILGYDFYGQESDWSNIQTITIGESQTSTPSPATTSSPAPTPTSSQEPPQIELIDPILAAAVVMAAIIAAVGAGLLFYFRKRKR